MERERRRDVWLRRATGGAALVLALGLVLGLGIYLTRAQKQATDQLKADFADRAHLTAKLFGDTLRSSEDSVHDAASAYAVPAGDLPTTIPLQQTGLNGVIVLTADGDVLSSGPTRLRADASEYASSTGFAQARTSGQLVWHNVVRTSAGYSAVVYAPVKAVDGQRVVVLLLPVQQVSTFGRAFLSTLGVLGGDTYIVDGAGQVVVASNGASVDQPVPDKALASALRRADSAASGTTTSRPRTSLSPPGGWSSWPPRRPFRNPCVPPAGWPGNSSVPSPGPWA